MHTEVFNNIDLLVEMAGSFFSAEEIESDLIAINKDIKNKKQKIEDLKNLMVDTRYFNASSELVDKNIEISLKSKISRLNKKIKDLTEEFNEVKEKESVLNREINALKQNLDVARKYVETLELKTSSGSTSYENIVKKEKEHLSLLEKDLKQKQGKYQAVLKEMELHKQALNELNSKLEIDKDRLQDVMDNLANPNTYIDEELKKSDEEKLQSLNVSLEDLEKKKLEYLTDPIMIAADAKELVIANDYQKALKKIQELLNIVKSKPFMDINNVNILDDELEKKESERLELANYIDSKNYDTLNDDFINKRKDYLTNFIKQKEEEIKQTEDTIKEINLEIEDNLSNLIQELETKIDVITKQIDSYKEMLEDKSKSKKTKANLENAIIKKEKEKEIMNDILLKYKDNLLFQINLVNTLSKLIKKYNFYIEQSREEISNLENLAVIETSAKDVYEEECDKDKLKNINEEINQIKKRKKYDRTPDEIYDQIEMILASSNSTKVLETKSKDDDIKIDDLFDDDLVSGETKRYKVVEMIPAKTVQASTNNGGVSDGN